MNSLAGDHETYLRVENLSKVYATRDGEVRALNDVSFTQRRGEFISHVGPSGCGKSTLLMIAAGLVPPSGGAIKVGAQKVDRPRTDIGIVFQSPVLLEWRTSLGNIMLQAEARHMDRSDARRRAYELLDSVGLGGFEDKYPHELSGGMRQRVSICRALIRLNRRPRALRREIRRVIEIRDEPRLLRLPPEPRSGARARRRQIHACEHREPAEMFGRLRA